MTPSELDEALPVVKPDAEALKNPDPERIQTTWIGHATALVQMEGVTFITDPIFSERCSPFSFMGPKRIRKVPLEVEELPPISFVVISHNHYDHMDFETIKRIGNKPVWYVPIGNKVFLESVGITNVIELSWWQSHQFNEKIKVVCLPAQHWSQRMPWTKNKALWSGWGVIGQKYRTFFAGDTGYCDAFKAIGKRYGPFNMSLIPIGAYCPRDFLEPQHVNPEEAVKMHIDLKSIESIGIHWGTFILTDEREDEPPKVLKDALLQYKLPEDSFICTKIGEVHISKDFEVKSTLD